jgi:hypothetical protein
MVYSRVDFWGQMVKEDLLMLIELLRKSLPLLGLTLVMASGCVKSTCEADSDCPVGKRCSNSACVPRCRDSSDCANGEVCAQNKCWPMTSSQPDAGLDDGGALACSCLQAPNVCLGDINPLSSTAGTSVCEPGEPPRATLLFFGNVGCSHCQNIFGQLLSIESQLRDEGFDPTLAFVQLKDWSYTGDEVTSTFPKHRGPVLLDTAVANFWDAYGADWYQAKIIDSHGCLSAFFAPPETQNLISDGRLLAAGTLLKDAWISAMGNECHALADAGVGVGSGP